jgi:hypothetical protein
LCVANAVSTRLNIPAAVRGMNRKKDIDAFGAETLIFAMTVWKKKRVLRRLPN